MNRHDALEPDSSPEHGAIERLVREHLERETSRVDATDLIARIRGDLPSAGRSDAAAAGRLQSRRVPAALGRRFLWPVAAAAGLWVAFLGGRYLESAAASPTALLRSVQAAHLQAVDRCYTVQFAPDPRYTDPSKPLERPTDNTLWTRGDCFWCDCAIGDRRLAVGRDASGQTWCAPSRRKGLLLPSKPSEVSPELKLICAINSMSIPRLMEEVLAGFEMHADPAPSAGAGATSLVSARLEPGLTHPLLSAAVMEIDARSGVLVRLVLWIVQDGHPHGTVTFTLVESAVKGVEQYRLSAHVDADAEIESQRANRE